MIMQILITLFAFCVVGYLLETLRMYLQMEKTYVTTRKMTERISQLLRDEIGVDVFYLVFLRDVIDEEYLERHKVDAYHLYKLDDHHIRLEFTIGRAEQSVDFAINDGRVIAHKDKIHYNEEMKLTN